MKNSGHEVCLHGGEGVVGRLSTLSSEVPDVNKLDCLLLTQNM